MTLLLLPKYRIQTDNHWYISDVILPRDGTREIASFCMWCETQDLRTERMRLGLLSSLLQHPKCYCQLLAVSES